MMWNNFFLQEEERRRGAASRRRARGPRSGLSPERERKARWTLLGTAVGVALAVLAVGTDYWVELNPAGDAACATAHLGLWKACTRHPRPAHGPPCGPARLHPGEIGGKGFGGHGEGVRGSLPRSQGEAPGCQGSPTSVLRPRRTPDLCISPSLPANQPVPQTPPKELHP